MKEKLYQAKIKQMKKINRERRNKSIKKEKLSYNGRSYSEYKNFLSKRKKLTKN